MTWIGIPEFEFLVLFVLKIILALLYPGESRVTYLGHVGLQSEHAFRVMDKVMCYGRGTSVSHLPSPTMSHSEIGGEPAIKSI